MEWSIQEIAKVVGTTSRTLRHYDGVGLLTPSRIGSNGYRRYDEAALLRLQRIMLLRELGLGLPQIAEVLEREASPQNALTGHLAWLRQEQHRVTRQIAAVEMTIEALQKGEEMIVADMFDGFDHSRYRDEVIERWGADAAASSDQWWSAKAPSEQSRWQREAAVLGADWESLAMSGAAADSDVAQDLAKRHVEWLRAIPGTPTATPGGDARGYVIGLGKMYVADPRFGVNYGGVEGASFVRDALSIYAEQRL